MDAQGSGPRGRKDDEVCVNENNVWLDEILDIKTGLDNTVAGKISRINTASWSIAAPTKTPTPQNLSLPVGIQLQSSV